MPLISVYCNVPMEKAVKLDTMKKLSSMVADVCGKPEKYVMTVFKDDFDVLLGGGEGPAALVEIALLGTFPIEDCETYCAKVKEILGPAIPGDKQYVRFVEYPSKNHWGWNGQTFAQWLK